MPVSPLLVVADGSGRVDVTLNRPEIRNALEPALVTSLIETILHVGADKETRVIVLSGAGRSFCAGGDLASLEDTAKGSYQLNFEDGARLDQLFRTVDECVCPLVAKVHGAALGGGTGLAACADVVIASDDAVFGCPEVQIGIAPAIVAPYILAKIGIANGRRLLLSGERLVSADAQRAGLVHHVVPGEELDGTTDKVVNGFLQGGAEAQRATKRLLRNIAISQSRELTSALTTLETARVRVSEEGRQGLLAVLERKNHQ